MAGEEHGERGGLEPPDGSTKYKLSYELEAPVDFQFFSKNMCEFHRAPSVLCDCHARLHAMRQRPWHGPDSTEHLSSVRVHTGTHTLTTIERPPPSVGLALVPARCSRVQHQRMAPHGLIPPPGDESYLVALRLAKPPYRAHTIAMSRNSSARLHVGYIDHRGVAAVVCCCKKWARRICGAGCNTKRTDSAMAH
eukprot:scaffold281749_cov40-Tisochrysis_lutea.AAC.3